MPTWCACGRVCACVCAGVVCGYGACVTCVLYRNRLSHCLGTASSFFGQFLERLRLHLHLHRQLLERLRLHLHRRRARTLEGARLEMAR